MLDGRKNPVMVGCMPHAVFITGATGYMGRPLAEELSRRGHAVRALVRPGSEGWKGIGV